MKNPLTQRPTTILSALNIESGRIAPPDHSAIRENKDVKLVELYVTIFSNRFNVRHPFLNMYTHTIRRTLSHTTFTKRGTHGLFSKNTVNPSITVCTAINMTS